MFSDLIMTLTVCSKWVGLLDACFGQLSQHCSELVAARVHGSQES